MSYPTPKVDWAPTPMIMNVCWLVLICSLVFRFVCLFVLTFFDKKTRPNRAGLRHVRGVRPNRAAKFRGAAILDPTEKNLLVWTTMIFIWRKLAADTRFDLSLDWLLFRHSLQCWPKNQNAATRCVLREYNTAKMRLVGSPPRTQLANLQRSPDPIGELQGRPGGCWVGHNAFGPTNN